MELKQLTYYEIYFDHLLIVYNQKSGLALQLDLLKSTI